MAPPERPAKSPNTEGGLRLLVRRSRSAIRLLSQALKQDHLVATDPNDTATALSSTPLNEQLNEAIDLTQALHARFALLEQHFALLSDKVELLGVRLNEPARRSEGEGTLRPPRVPQGLGVPGDPSTQANGFTARTFGTPSEPRQQSGFGMRAGSENVRAGRSGAGGPLLSGNITGLSLSSLFSLFEFERSSGSLTIQHGARRLDLLLHGGRVVRCELDGVCTAATAAVREAFGWTASTFSFRRDPEQDDAEPPQSVNALMLDAMRFHDEELRAG